MHRILILGPMGSGKSTFAQQLGEKLAIPVIHLDAHYWRPNWIKPERQTWRLQQQAMVQGEQWIIDGFYPSTLDERLPYADTVILLDLPPWQCFWRVIKRQWRQRGRNRIDLNAGCVEQLNWESIRFAWQAIMQHYPKQRTVLLNTLKQQPTNLIHIQNTQQIQNILLNI